MMVFNLTNKIRRISVDDSHSPVELGYFTLFLVDDECFFFCFFVLFFFLILFLS